MPLAPLGKAQQYCSVFNFQLLFRGLFFTALRALPKNADWLAAPIGHAHYKGGKKLAAFRPFGKTMPIHFALLGRKRKYIKSKTMQTNLDRRGLRPISIICHCLDHRVHILVEMKQGQCICPLSWSVHSNFSGEGKCKARTDFTLITECTPESSSRNSVYSVVLTPPLSPYRLPLITRRGYPPPFLST